MFGPVALALFGKRCPARRSLAGRVERTTSVGDARSVFVELIAFLD